VSETTGLSTTILTPPECLALLAQASVGRVGASIDALPVIMPVFFALFEESVIFRTTPGTRLDAAINGAVVAFQADGYPAPGPENWSVLLQGIAREVTEPGELAMVRSVPMAHWTESGGIDRWIRIRNGTLSGRRFG
jgi:nitroimidazol reductase NimA-like FMN-containing flavoprotein (pyridoxamine 5'-phosphate oxidase superfamily)